MAPDLRLLALGFHFLPTDEDLIVNFLLRKLMGLPLPSGDFVKDCNLYGDLEPWEIWRRFRGGGDVGGQEDQEDLEDDDDDTNNNVDGQAKRNDLYFFTPLKKRKNSSLRIERTVGSNGGSWKGEDVGKVYHTSDGEVSWTQKRFSYKNNNKRKKKDGSSSCSPSVSWIMHEYTLLLDRPIPWLPWLDSASVSSLALCRIRKKDKSSKNRKKVIYIEAIDDDYYDDDYGEVVVEAEESMIQKKEACCSSQEQSIHKRRKLDGSEAEKEEETKGGGGGDDGEEKEEGSWDEELATLLSEEETKEGGGGGSDDDEEEGSLEEELKIWLPEEEEEVVASQALITAGTQED